MGHGQEALEAGLGRFLNSLGIGTKPRSFVPSAQSSRLPGKPCNSLDLFLQTSGAPFPPSKHERVCGNRFIRMFNTWGTHLMHQPWHFVPTSKMYGSELLYSSGPPLRSLAPAQDPTSGSPLIFLKIVKPTNSLRPDRDPTV